MVCEISQIKTPQISVTYNITIHSWHLMSFKFVWHLWIVILPKFFGWKNNVIDKKQDFFLVDYLGEIPSGKRNLYAQLTDTERNLSVTLTTNWFLGVCIWNTRQEQVFIWDVWLTFVFAQSLQLYCLLYSI